MARIMVVDNASFMRSVLKYIMETGGHKVVGSASDGKEAIRLYSELKPDVVTMDVVMEGMDGIQVLDAIRKIDPLAKVVMVTAVGNEKKIKEAQSLGASGCIKKPFNNSEIMALISSLTQENKAGIAQKG